MTLRLDKIAATLHGTLWIPNPTPGQPPIRKVAQLTAHNAGNVPGSANPRQQIRAHVIPFDPRTPAQIVQRQRMRDAMQAWTAADQTTRDDYTGRARPLKISGINLWCRERL